MTSKVGTRTHANDVINIIRFAFRENSHEGRYSPLKIVVKKEFKGYFQDTNDDEMIKEIPKMNASMQMRDTQHINSVQFTRIQIIATELIGYGLVA